MLSKDTSAVAEVRFIYPTRGVREFHGAAVNPGFYLSLDSDPCGCDEHEIIHSWNIVLLL